MNLKEIVFGKEEEINPHHVLYAKQMYKVIPHQNLVRDDMDILDVPELGEAIIKLTREEGLFNRHYTGRALVGLFPDYSLIHRYNENGDYLAFVDSEGHKYTIAKVEMINRPGLSFTNGGSAEFVKERAKETSRANKSKSFINNN